MFAYDKDQARLDASFDQNLCTSCPVDQYGVTRNTRKRRTTDASLESAATTTVQVPRGATSTFATCSACAHATCPAGHKRAGACQGDTDEHGCTPCADGDYHPGITALVYDVAPGSKASTAVITSVTDLHTALLDAATACNAHPTPPATTASGSTAPPLIPVFSQPECTALNGTLPSHVGGRRLPFPPCVAGYDEADPGAAWVLCKAPGTLSGTCFPKNPAAVECDVTQYKTSNDTVKDRNDFACANCTNAVCQGDGFVRTGVCDGDTTGFQCTLDWRAWMKDNNCALRSPDNQLTCGACWVRCNSKHTSPVVGGCRRPLGSSCGRISTCMRCAA